MNNQVNVRGRNFSVSTPKTQKTIVGVTRKFKVTDDNGNHFGDVVVAHVAEGFTKVKFNDSNQVSGDWKSAPDNSTDSGLVQSAIFENL